MSVRNTVGNPGEAVERRLVARLASGDRIARRRLIEAYLGLVTALARRYAGRCGVPLEDLVQEGRSRWSGRWTAMIRRGG